MGLILITFSTIFWGGVILLILAHVGIISVSPWAILIVWLILLGLYVSALIWIVSKTDFYESAERIEETYDIVEYKLRKKFSDGNQEVLDQLSKIDKVGREKIEHMEEMDRYYRRSALMHDDYGV